jgi:hypothetical protein
MGFITLSGSVALAQGIDPDAPGGVAVTAAPAAATSPVMILPNGAIPPVAASAPAEALTPGSVFITEEELAKINEAIAAYKRMKDAQNVNAENQAKNFLNQLEDIKSEITPEEVKEEPYTYPQFHLETLGYHSPKDWILQVNGQKFGPHLSSEGSALKVISIDKEKVLLEWYPAKMEKVLEVWDNTFNELTGTNVDVFVDRERNTVTFELRPNQTFSSYVMRVLEGKVRPVTIYPPPAEEKQGVAAVGSVGPDGATPVAAPVPVDDKKEGLSGLAETYKKVGLGEEK